MSDPEERTPAKKTGTRRLPNPILPARGGGEPRCALSEGQGQPDQSPVPGGNKLRRPRRGRSTLARRVPVPRLYTATIIYANGRLMMQAFHASVAHHYAEVVQRLRSRFGDDVVEIAELRCGFHPATPVAVAIVPPAVADMIRATERDCGAPSALAFVVDIEQRIEI